MRNNNKDRSSNNDVIDCDVTHSSSVDYDYVTFPSPDNDVGGSYDNDDVIMESEYYKNDARGDDGDEENPMDLIGCESSMSANQWRDVDGSRSTSSNRLREDEKSRLTLSNHVRDENRSRSANERRFEESSRSSNQVRGEENSRSSTQRTDKENSRSSNERRDEGMGREEGRGLESVQCVLESRELWKKFHELGTEMIITKSGRSVSQSFSLFVSVFRALYLYLKVPILLL